MTLFEAQMHHTMNREFPLDFSAGRPAGRIGQSPLFSLYYQWRLSVISESNGSHEAGLEMAVGDTITATPPNIDKWPDGVRSITIDEMDYIGLDAGHRLYWDGERVVTLQVQRLAWFERGFGALAVVAAVCGVIIQAWSWGCELQRLGPGQCPPVNATSAVTTQMDE